MARSSTFPITDSAPLWKTAPAVLERHSKKVAAEKRLAEAYRQVDQRDGKRCWVTGKPLTAGHADEWRRLERHHLASRGAAPERRDDPENILSVSAGVHALFGSGALLAVDAKGEETTHVSLIAGYRWTREGRPPFRMRTR